MKIIALFAVVTVVTSYNLETVLQSPSATLKLYQTFLANHHFTFPTSENKFRFRLFRDNANLVVGLNRQTAGSAWFGLNKFSVMTEEEKQQYLGLNITEHLANSVAGETEIPTSVPDKMLWTSKGGVTKVQDQGKCGSCWTFGAIGSLETHYHKSSGVLRKFSEQELLDCVFENWRDGCRGGWLPICYEYAKNTSRLASSADYPYVAKDGKCIASTKPDALKAYKISGHVSVGKTEADNIAALAQGALAMAVEVTNSFRYYMGGILIDTTCRGRVSHAIIGVGYTKTFILIKNSWGADWGEQGFLRFSRDLGVWHCGLFKYSVYPKLTATGKADSGSDPKTDYHPPEKCEDAPNKDPNYCSTYKSHCWHKPIAVMCMKTCGKC